MNQDWYQQFTRQFHLKQLDLHKLTPNHEHVDTFIATLHATMERLSTEAKDPHDYTKLFYKLLQEPHGLFTAFFYSIVYSTEEHDHSYTVFHGLRGVFNDIIIESAHRLSKASISAVTRTSPTEPDQMTNYTSEVGCKTVAYIAGWALVRARRMKPHLANLVASIGTDVYVNDKYIMEASDDYIIFFKSLSALIHENMNEQAYQGHKNQLPAVVKDQVKSNLPIRLAIRNLLSGYDECNVTSLLQEIVQGTIQSAVKQFLDVTHRHPNKESHAHRISVSLEQNNGKKCKKQDKYENDCVSSKCKIKATNWVQCEKCDRWWHYKCAGLTKKTVPEGEWFCGRCKESD